MNKKLWCTKSKNTSDFSELNMQSDISAADRASDWLPESVIDELRNINDGNIQRIVEEVTKESSEIGGSVSTDPLICDEINSNFVDTETLTEVDEHITETNVADDITDTPIERKFELTLQSAAAILDALKQDKKTKQKWETGTIEIVLDALSSPEKVRSLSHSELNAVYESMKENIEQKFRLLKRSWIKDNKIQFVCGVLGICSVELNDLKPKQRVKLISPLSLSKIALKVMASKKYPKAVLRCAYTSYKFPSVLKKWQLEAPIPCPTEIQGVDRQLNYGSPTPNIMRKRALC